jgi:hypothetical protein
VITLIKTYDRTIHLCPHKINNHEAAGSIYTTGNPFL